MMTWNINTSYYNDKYKTYSHPALWDRVKEACANTWELMNKNNVNVLFNTLGILFTIVCIIIF